MQLPIYTYFSEDFQKEEIDRLFQSKDSLKYVGHELMIPNNNDYIVPSSLNDRWAMFNRNREFSLQSNVCLHRQAKLLEGSGNTKLTSCQVHCWTYDESGKLKATPHFKEKIEGHLKKINLRSWNRLLFNGRIPDFDLKKCGIEDYVDFSEYGFYGSDTTEYEYNWKTFVEIYLENYHVFSMHPGLRKFVTPSDLEWHFGEDYSVQKVGLGSDLDAFGSEIYKQWQNVVKQKYGQDLPRYGAIWIYIYPNIMIEWYPHTIAISTIYPKEPQKCVNYVEYYFKKDIQKDFPEYYEAIQKVYSETAAEDETACLLLDRGRKSLYLNGENETGPCDTFLEAGVQHFYDYLRRKINL